MKPEREPHFVCDVCGHVGQLTRFDGKYLCPTHLKAAKRGQEEQRYHTERAKEIERGERRPK